jgi:DNA polymerase-3 subunit epsilon
MILFFDTETTGLPKNWKAPASDLNNWPRLVQLAYVIYDFEGNLIHSCNEIIRPNGFVIPDDAAKIHGISNSIANQRGIEIKDVFEVFSIYLKRASLIVAHNIAYDEKIISSEMIRLGLEDIIESKEKICTMLTTVDVCKIHGPYGYKWPKLEELHLFLFKCNFEGAHNALADVEATAKCFWELVKNDLIKLQKFKTKSSYKQNTQTSAIENIQIAVNEQRAIFIRYRDLDGKITEQVLINVDFSENVFAKDDIDFFQIDSNYITGTCLKLNEKRTYKISQIIHSEIITEKPPRRDHSNIKQPILIPCNKNGIEKVINSRTSQVVLYKEQHYTTLEMINYFSDNTLILEKDGRFALFQNKSNYKSLKWFDKIKKLDENFVLITYNSKQRIFNLTNSTIINDYWFDQIHINTKTDSRHQQTVIYFNIVNKKAVACNFGNWGIINFNNETLLDFKYDFIEIINEDMVVISRLNKWGLLKLKTMTWICELFYDEYISCRMPFIIFRSQNNFLLFNTDTCSVILDSYSKISFINNYFILTDLKNKCGVFDPSVNYLSPCNWDIIDDYDGRYIYFENNKKKGCFDINNNVQIGDAIFTKVSRFLLGIAKVQINDKIYFLSDSGVLDELKLLPIHKSSSIHEIGPVTIFQFDDFDYSCTSDFMIYLGNKLITSYFNFKREKRKQKISDIRIELRKSIVEDNLYFCISQLTNWNTEDRIFFSLKENKIDSDTFYYEGCLLGANVEWNVQYFNKEEIVYTTPYDKFIPVEDTDWKIENNSKEEYKILFKDELRFKFNAQQFYFGPFINGITQLYVCYYADHEGGHDEYFGFVDINGNQYFDFNLNADTNNNFSNEHKSCEDDCDLPF